MLMRFDPFRELDRLTQQVAGNGRPAVMPMDAYRAGDHFIVHFDLPGVDAGSIELTVEKNVLTVTAERRWQPQNGQEVLVTERPQGSFSRQLFLGEGLDAERIEANYDNGVLTITVPVAEQAKPRKVEITSSPKKSQAIDTQSSETQANAAA
ncbi:MAG: Hsp20/alpha crystallin family protein [Actinobacteria bacterium]|nr:Hsp20/alpha crystallin family protein [Actinomycetota bacterium]MBW3649875.1 Hsp20/alpha crystallin family protein [Actinomycetota bacterium]